MRSASNIPEVLAFLRQLAINNDRTWFKARKTEFDALRGAWEQDMERLIALVAEYYPDVRGLGIKECVYRIYRDIRFSHDKSPYKTYFSGVIGSLMIMGIFGGTVFPLLMGFASDAIGQLGAVLVMAVGVVYLFTYIPKVTKS